MIELRICQREIAYNCDNEDNLIKERLATVLVIWISYRK